MMLSVQQLALLRSVASAGAVSVRALVADLEASGMRRPVARAGLSRALRRLWRLGAVELRGTRRSLVLDDATGFLLTRRRQPRASRLLRYHRMCGSLVMVPLTTVARVYVRSVALTVVGRSLLEADDFGYLHLRGQAKGSHPRRLRLQ